MKKIVIWAAALMLSGNTFALTDHYLRRDGNHVQHLKITTNGDDIRASMDVDFEPTGSAEEGRKTCSAEVSGDAKKISDTELSVRAQVEGEARQCTLKIKLSNEGATVEQSKDCSYFVAGICHFDSDGRELFKIK